MKAIIPVAGLGTHLRPHTYTQPKPLIPVAGKPILGHIIERLLAAGVEDYVFVIGYLGEKIEAYVSRVYPEIRANFVSQHTREGLGHAIWLTRHVVNENEPVCIALGDTIFEVDLESVLNSGESALGVKKVDRPDEFGVAEISEDGLITRLVEKPDIPKSNMALVGLYVIQESKALFKALDMIVNTGKRTQSEFHLTDGIQSLVEDGVTIRAFKVRNWYDCGKVDILLETNATLLRKQEEDDTDWAARYPDSIIVPPVAIAKGAKIQHSIVGPNVTIGDKTVVRSSILRDSIIGNYARLADISLHNSVIGSDTAIKGSNQSLNIGDNTELNLG
jgi:glucose-1-phosphate thymidylyltransferase